MSKYGNKKLVTQDGVFDSQKEFQRWCELRLLERAGYITDLERQKPFVLIPKQKDDHGKVIERECKYVADFFYTENGKQVVEDTKGFKTKEYIIKRKLMLEKYSIRIKEV